jgi:hypothetical protein
MKYSIVFCLLLLCSHSGYSGSRPSIKNTVIWENRIFKIINEIDLTGKNYDLFARIADSGKVFTNKNKYSRLFLVKKSNWDTLLDIPMIPSTHIEYKNGQICCLTQYVFSGVPQVTIVNSKGIIKAVQFLLPLCYYCDTAIYFKLKQLEDSTFSKLESLNSVQFSGDKVKVCMGGAIAIFGENSISSLMDSVVQHCQSSNLGELPYNSVLTSNGRLLWYSEDCPNIRWRVHRKKSGVLLFKSYMNKNEKLRLYCGYPNRN